MKHHLLAGTAGPPPGWDRQNHAAYTYRELRAFGLSYSQIKREIDHLPVHWDREEAAKQPGLSEEKTAT